MRMEETVVTEHSLEGVRDIINDWDPIGLFPMAPDDEYEEPEELCLYTLGSTLPSMIFSYAVWTSLNFSSACFFSYSDLSILESG